MCRFRTQGGEWTRSRPPKAKFGPVCKTKPVAWSAKNPRVRGTRLFLRKSAGFLRPVWPCMPFFTRGWGNDPTPTPKSQIWVPVGKVEKARIRASGEVKKVAGERVGAENRRLPRATAPGRAGRFGISPWGQFWLFAGSDFAPWSQRWGQNNENFPAASHFPRCHCRGQRKDERLWKKKKT